MGKFEYRFTDYPSPRSEVASPPSRADTGQHLGGELSAESATPQRAHGVRAILRVSLNRPWSLGFHIYGRAP